MPRAPQELSKLSTDQAEKMLRNRAKAQRHRDAVKEAGRPDAYRAQRQAAKAEELSKLSTDQAKRRFQNRASHQRPRDAVKDQSIILLLAGGPDVEKKEEEEAKRKLRAKAKKAEEEAKRKLCAKAKEAAKAAKAEARAQKKQSKEAEEQFAHDMARKVLRALKLPGMMKMCLESLASGPELVQKWAQVVRDYGRALEALRLKISYWDMEGRGIKYPPYSASLLGPGCDETWIMNPLVLATLAACQVYPKPKP
jgi:hypothetical protein